LAQGQRGSRAGVVVATAHTGNWDLVACALAQRVSLTVITKRLSVGWLNRLWQSFSGRRGVGLVEAGQAASRAGWELRNGGWVATMIDQAPERRRGTLALQFLGEVAEVDLAPALLAARARCPLVIAFPLRSAQGHSIRLVRVLHPPQRAGRAWAEGAMREATQALETLIRQHPEQWLWMHRRWKRTTSPKPDTDPSSA
jgi:KDO2-lipid IV(A) lauroyltransferase